MYLSFLNYLALFLLFFIVISFFYAIIALCDIPYQIAKKRNHPQQDAIQIAGWLSLLTLQILWPLVWIWATLYREDRGWGFQQSGDAANSTLQPLEQQLSQLQSRFDKLEQAVSETSSTRSGKPGKPLTQNSEGGL